MYESDVTNVGGRTADVAGSAVTDSLDGVSNAFAATVAFCVCGDVMNWISCQVAPLCLDAEVIQMPNGWISSQCSGLAGWHGMTANLTSLPTLDLFGSSTSGIDPESSCHIATRPCWKSERQLVTR